MGSISENSTGFFDSLGWGFVTEQIFCRYQYAPIVSDETQWAGSTVGPYDTQAAGPCGCLGMHNNNVQTDRQRMDGMDKGKRSVVTTMQYLPTVGGVGLASLARIHGNFTQTNYYYIENERCQDPWFGVKDRYRQYADGMTRYV